MQTVLTNPKRPALRLLPRQRCAGSRCAKAAAACAPGAGHSARQAAQCPQPGCAYTPGTNRLATVHGNRRPSGSPALAYKYDASGRMAHKTGGPAQRYPKYDMTGKVTGIYRNASCNTALATFTPDDLAQSPVVAYTYLRGVQAETWQQFQTALRVPDPGTVEVALGSDDLNWQADCDDLRPLLCGNIIGASLAIRWL